MTLFDDRERAFELRYVHELEMRFRQNAARVRLIAERLAERMNIAPDDRPAYVAGVLHDMIVDGNESSLAARLMRDSEARGLTLEADEWAALGALPPDEGATPRAH